MLWQQCVHVNKLDYLKFYAHRKKYKGFVLYIKMEYFFGISLSGNLMLGEKMLPETLIW